VKIKVGLFGTVGHQIHNDLKNHPKAEITGLCGFAPEQIPEHLKSARIFQTLETMLADESIQLISFCSSFKDEQGEQIIQTLEAGKHVYAEKPCCLSEAVLDQIIATSKRTGMRFHEMNASSLAQPYCTIREIVKSGAIGEVIQILSQKSYPWADWRPKDERNDGGLTRQVGLYNVRFAEHVAGLKVQSLEIKETQLGNDIPDSDCRRAVSMLMTFENGAVGSAVANYSCPQPPDWNQWGYENLRIFGTKGFVESIDAGRIGTLALAGQPPQDLDFSAPGQDMLELFLEEIETGEDRVPFTLEEELRPTRWVLRAKA
jgi:predicted dehydrogenase